MSGLSEGTRRWMAEHRELLNHLAREGDCRACLLAQIMGADGCTDHSRGAPIPQPEEVEG